VTGWLVPSAGQEIPVQPGWYLPPQKILLDEKQVSSGRQLKIQRKNPGSALLMRIGVAAMSHMHNGM